MMDDGRRSHAPLCVPAIEKTLSYFNRQTFAPSRHPPSPHSLQQLHGHYATVKSSARQTLPRPFEPSLCFRWLFNGKTICGEKSVGN